MKLIFVRGLLLFAIGVSPAWAQSYIARHHEIISQMQIMARGSYTEAEWNGLITKLDDILAESKQSGDLNGIIETEVLRAKVLSARGRHGEAMTLMKQVLDEYKDQKLTSLKKVYVEIASLYAREGNEQGVNAIMSDFKSSPNFDGNTYSFSGGDGPQDPLVVPRPRVAVGDSVSMTAMEVQRTRAQHAPGTLFPDFNANDWAGKHLALKDFEGKVLLIDFWADSFVWRRDLPYRKSIYERHHPRGFEILGLYLGLDAATGRAFAQANGMTWPMGPAPKPLLKHLGIYGDVTNILIDRQGVVVGRDLYGADLEAAVSAALAR